MIQNCRGCREAGWPEAYCVVHANGPMTGRARPVRPIGEEVIEQTGKMIEEGKTPVSVIFSHAGWERALKEMNANNHGGPDSEYYCGLTRAIDGRADTEVVVIDKTPREYFKRGGYVRPTGPQGSGQPIRVTVTGLGGPLTAEVLGKHLTAAQLCGIIQGFLDADDFTHFGAFEHSLEALLKVHGTFE